ncbi:uncharacterized protein EI97DRAFT_466878 [Westerdykella ornata]|uniref:C3H1-type domain-containing protein n=1 Tax=Westerdykella ornata TaxID=318751 RepID=A0A6A6JJV1_WESOR|nr:uncharacterized protein EI97DRAFT_466878 [Westerdykella ornata]KAF2276742.1 hypothetical protein EI97DRAFT_466878 [Westerdykella ornata]
MVVLESESAASTQRAQLPTGIRYYIVRPDKTMVPLVPADQLPFQLNGIPRQLSHQQLSSEKWEYFADTNDPKTIFSVRAWDADTGTHKAPSHSHRDIRETRPARETTVEPSTPPRTHVAPDHNVRMNANDKRSTPEAKEHPSSPRFSQLESPRLPVSSSRPVAREPEKSPTSLTASIANVYRKDAQRLGYTPVLPPSGIKPDASKKEYCTHWISRGECAFMAQGCLYKHEMPSLEKLREIGFKNEPRWWKEKNAIQSRGPTWMQRRLQHTTEDENDVEEGEVIPKPGQEHVHDLFKRIKSSSDRTVMKQLNQERTKTALEEEARPTTVSAAREQTSNASAPLIDFEPPVITSSRRSSCSSSSAGLSTDTEPSSSARSSGTGPRVRRSGTREKSTTMDQRSSLPRENSEAKSQTTKVVPFKRSGSTVGSKSVRPHTYPNQTASAKPATKGGLALSKHAVPAITDTLSATTRTRMDEDESSAGIRKQLNKLKREHHANMKQRQNASEQKSLIPDLI